jgi:hypothetical protein
MKGVISINGVVKREKKKIMAKRWHEMANVACRNNE